MSQQTPEQNIRELANSANASIRHQQEKSAALAAAQPKPSSTKKIFMIILLLAFAGTAWVQYPRFHEPFGRPDPNQDQAVAEADLRVIALELEAYKVSQGNYPATLDQARLPDFLAAFVSEQKIDYKPTEKGYVLDWKLPRWRAVFDGESGKVAISPANGTK